MRYANQGFTLIEIIIATGIMMVTGSVILAGFNNFNATQKVKQARLTLKSNIRLAQSKAVTGLKPSAGCPELKGYSIVFKQNSYETQAQCSTGAVGAIDVIKLPASVFIQSSPASVTFAVLSGTADVSSIIMFSNGNSYYGVQVSTSGDVIDVESSSAQNAVQNSSVVTSKTI